MTRITEGTSSSKRWGLPRLRDRHFRRRIRRAIGGGPDKDDIEDQGLRAAAAAAATAGASGGGVAVADVGVDEDGGAFQKGRGGQGGSGQSSMGFEVSLFFVR